MREIAYKNLTSAKRRRKIMSVQEVKEDRKAKTTTLKTFIYIVDSGKNIRQDDLKPTFHITKVVNSKTKTEKFLLRIKGLIYVTTGRYCFPVRYSHSLKIDIAWKKKSSSLNTVV